MAIPCITLPTIPSTDEEAINSITVYSKDYNQNYILVTFEDDGIYEYDIQNSIWSSVIKWEDKKIMRSTDLEGHGCAIDNINGKLHLFGGFDPFYAILNIKTKQLDVKCCYIHEFHDSDGCLSERMDMPDLLYAKGVYIASDLHIIAFDSDHRSMKHLIIDTTKFCINDIKQSEPSFWNQRRSKFEIIYAKVLKQFMFIGGRKDAVRINKYHRTTRKRTRKTTHSRDIFYCNIQDFKWKRSDMKLPLNLSDKFFVFIAYDYIIFVIYPTVKDIWCLDLLDATWYQSEKKFIIENLPIRATYLWNYCVQCIKVDENIVHFISHHETDSTDFDSDSSNDTNNVNNYSFHFSICILDIISTKLRNKYTMRYHMLISGYLRGCGLFIPLDIVQLLLHFYSGLC